MSDTPDSLPRGEVETPRPLHARAGRVALSGWCLEAADRIPPVRLVCGEHVLPATERHARADFGGLPCGFTLGGSLPAGVYEARFEAQRADGSWFAFRHYSLRVDPAPIDGALEWPIPRGILDAPARPAGWVAHPTQTVTAVTLRYGHQEIATEFPLDRPDVAARYPDKPAYARSGFIANRLLPAGHGPLRVRAHLANGTVTVLPTDVRVAIDSDVNTPAELDLAAPRVALPGYGPARAASPAAADSAPRNVLFLLPGTFAANHALHVASLANELAAAGHRCAVAVRDDLATLAHHAAPGFVALTHADALAHRFTDGRGPDLVHAWTTRETVRAIAEQLRAAHGCRLVVHLEDNEQQILAQTLGRSVAELEQMSAAELDRLVPSDLSHPTRSREFLARADGVTVIADPLRTFVPAGKRCLTLWPAADERFFFPRPRSTEFRRLLDPTSDTTVLFYHGNVHAANAAEVRELYAAVADLNAGGQSVTLIRTGLDAVDFLGADAPRLRAHVLELGQVLHHRHLPPLMALADFFVQPGAPDAFNDYRFPSKLPEFFALGRPVVLPRTNLGARVRHGIDAYVLERADAAGIATAVRALRADPALAERLARGAGAFAAENFSWRRSAQALASFYGALAPS